MADVGDPAGFGPLLRRGRQGRTVRAVLLQHRQTQPDGTRVGSKPLPPWGWAVEVENHLTLRMEHLQVTDELEGLFDLPGRIVWATEDERKLRNNAILLATTRRLECVLYPRSLFHLF